MHRILISLFFIVFSFMLVFSQKDEEYHDFGFERDISITVKTENGAELPQPWVGGLNACQFSEIDLNFDGIKDLFVFDRHGHRILPFLNNGTPGEVDYTYAPEYIKDFPVMREWVNLVDYNCDGKEDIFTYTTGGIRVYKNVSDTSLKFKLEVPLLYSYYYSGFVNLFALIDDYPVFDDIDGDGDMDILNFFILGKYLNYHKNQSMEKYGKCDSLEFRLEENCWGYFEENESSNVVTLDIDCPGKCSGQNPVKMRDRHAGSSMLSLDMDNDGVKDLLLGDLDFSSITGLANTGTSEAAFIGFQDTLYPGNSKAIDLISMPLPCYVDVDNDGQKDLLVSPSDPGLARCKMTNSVWRYNNLGATNSPIFVFEQENFLQDQMVDVGGGAYPVIHDIDGDGLDDMIIGNWGYLDSTYYSLGFLYLIYYSRVAYYKNIGAVNSPVYKLMDDDLADISALEIMGAYPAFADLDGDHDVDMLVGNQDGRLFYYENLAGQGNEPQYADPVYKYMDIDVGDYSTPQLFDLNMDGLSDLVIGEMEANLNYYENTGTTNQPVFVFITDSLGKVNVTDENVSLFGFSTPCFFEDDDKLSLFVGSESGYIFYYSDIEDNLESSFTLMDDKLLYIREGIRTGVAVNNLDGDNYVDMIIGNYGGGVSLFKGVAPPPLGISKYIDAEHPELIIYPNPATDLVNIGINVSCNSELVIQNLQLQIIDGFGRTVFKSDLSSYKDYMDINVSTFPPGIYIISVYNGERLFCKDKLVVLR